MLTPELNNSSLTFTITKVSLAACFKTLSSSTSKPQLNRAKIVSWLKQSPAGPSGAEEKPDYFSLL